MDSWKIVNGDVALSTKGGVGIISGSHKIKQDLENWLLNDMGYNKFHPWMGASLEDFVGQTPSNTLIHNVRARVRDSLNRYLQAQILELKVRIEEMGNPYAAMGAARPSSLVREWDDLRVGFVTGGISIKISFRTFADEEDEVLISLRNFSITELNG